MNELEKLKKHLGKPTAIVLKNSDGEEDTFYFKNLSVGQQALLMEISRAMNSREKVVVEGKEYPSVKKEDMDEALELVKDICKSSFPEADEEVISEFANNNFEQIFSQLDKLMPNKTKEEVNLINKRKEMIDEKKSK